MTKSEKVISLRQKLNQTSTLAWKVKVDSVFYLATFPNNHCLHNASHMTQWVLTPATAWSVLVRAGPTCTSTGKLVMETKFYISGWKTWNSYSVRAMKCASGGHIEVFDPKNSIHISSVSKQTFMFVKLTWTFQFCSWNFMR